MQMRITFLLLVSSLLLSASPVLAGKRLTIANHGLRFLGLTETEQGALKASLGLALSQHRRLTLVGAAGGERCGRKVHCHCRAARKAGATRVVFGNIGRIGQIFTFELVLVESQSCEVENSVFTSETHSLATARDRIVSLVGRLTTPLDSLTETVVKEEREIDAVPAVVTVFTAKQIRQLGIQKFEELLHLVPGFEALDTNWGTPVLHQGLPGTILYLVDGVPLSNPMFNFTSLHQDFLISLNHIQRVEFIRGPGSVLWGANAYLGIINFITNTPTETMPRLTAQATYGTLGTGDFHASVGQSHRWFKYFLSTTLNLSHGPPSFVADSIYGDVLSDGDLVWGNGGSTDNQGDFYYDIVAKLEVARRLTFMLSIIDHRDNFQISPYGSLLTPESNGTWHKWHRLYGLTWEDTLPRGFRYRISGSRYEYRFWENFALHPPNEEVLPDGLRALQGNEVTPQVNHLAEVRLYHTYSGSFWSSNLLLGGSFLHQKMPNNYADLHGGDHARVDPHPGYGVPELPDLLGLLPGGAGALGPAVPLRRPAPGAPQPLQPGVQQPGGGDAADPPPERQGDLRRGVPSARGQPALLHGGGGGQPPAPSGDEPGRGAGAGPGAGALQAQGRRHRGLAL